MLRLESVDTNILMRLLLADHEDHYERAKKLLTTPRCIFLVPDQVILEMVFLLTRKTFRLKRPSAVSKIKNVLSMSRLDYDKITFSRVFDLYLAHPKLSIVDCYLATKMEDSGRTPFWTFDEKLAKQMPAAKLA